jgi:hypothetical protein
MLSAFQTQAMFNVYSLTGAINRMPYKPGLIGRLNLYTPSPLSQTVALFEQRNNTLALVPALPRGAPATVDLPERRSLVPVVVPHFPLDSSILADELLGVRAFGTDNQLEAWSDKVDQRLSGMNDKLDVTLEWLRLGGCKGVVITRVDRDTGAPLQTVDLFALFGVTKQATLTWPILPPATGFVQSQSWAGVIASLCTSLRRMMAAELGGLPMFGNIMAICGSQFFDAVTGSPEVRATYLNTVAAASLRENNYGAQVTYQGVTFVEYIGGVGALQFVAPNKAYFFPTGVPGLFVEAYAPADYIETVNTLALPRYAKQEVMDFDRGVQLESQMNVIPVCTIPRVLFEATATATTLTFAAGTAVVGPADDGTGEAEPQDVFGQTEDPTAENTVMNAADGSAVNVPGAGPSRAGRSSTVSGGAARPATATTTSGAAGGHGTGHGHDTGGAGGGQGRTKG